MSEVASSQLEPVEATSIQLPTSSRYGNDLALPALAGLTTDHVSRTDAFAEYHAQ